MVIDEWSDWLLHRRHGDDPELEVRIRAELEKIAGRVLDGAALGPDMRLLDVGTGDGLIAFKAIDRVGPGLKVVMTDVSSPILAHAQRIAARRGVSSQCSYHLGSAEKLTDIESNSVDAVTTRSVLAYVMNKDAALGEFFRVLKPGGRLSIAEPLFREDALEGYVLRSMVEANAGDPGIQSIRILHRVKASQFPDTPDAIARAPHTNYSERDLLGLVQRSGFSCAHLELHIDIRPLDVRSWPTFLKMSPHPWAPPLEQILNKELAPDERRLYEESIRPKLECGELLTTDRMVYISARKSVASAEVRT